MDALWLAVVASAAFFIGVAATALLTRPERPQEPSVSLTQEEQDAQVLVRLYCADRPTSRRSVVARKLMSARRWDRAYRLYKASGVDGARDPWARWMSFMADRTGSPTPQASPGPQPSPEVVAPNRLRGHERNQAMSRNGNWVQPRG
jgi:hypothetical protein